MVVAGIEDTQPQILSRRGMAVIVLGLVAYLEWFGLYTVTEEDGEGKCEEEEEAVLTLGRGEKVKSTMKLDGPGRCESASTHEAGFIGSNCLKIHFGFEYHVARKKILIKYVNIWIKSRLFFLANGDFSLIALFSYINFS